MLMKFHDLSLSAVPKKKCHDHQLNSQLDPEDISNSVGMAVGIAP